MLLMLLQIRMRFFPDFIFFFLLPIIALTEIVVLKIGLKLTHAPEHKSMKWVLASFGIQVAVIFFVASPLILLGLIGQFQGDPSLIIAFILLALFIDLNILNAIHKLGFKKALVVFVLMMIPVAIMMGIIGSITSQVG